MNIQYIINKLVGTPKDKKIGPTSSNQEKTTITCASMEQEADMEPKLTSQKTSSHLTQETKNESDKTKRQYSKPLKDEEVDEAIRIARNRLAYLLNRKKTGVPGGKSRGIKRSNKVKEMDAEKHFYYYWQKKGFIDEYVKRRETAIEAAKTFASFHNRIFKVVNKYGTDIEKENLAKVMGGDNDEIKL